jgi:hypothetical protein
MSPSDGTSKWLRRQHGLITRNQALEAGFSPGWIRQQVLAGRWERVCPGVYRLSAVRPTFEQKCLAAVLAAGRAAVVSHWSAARLLGVAPMQQPTISISIPNGSRARAAANAGVVIHRPRQLATRDRAILQGIPLTKPARLLVDLAAETTRSELEDLVDDVLFRYTGVTAARVLETLDRAKPRAGGPALRAALGPWREGPRPGSPPEIKILRRLVDAGLPAPIRQHEIYAPAGEFVARPDLAYVPERIAIEYLGARFHGPRRSTEDERRRRNLMTNGWQQVDAYADDADPATCGPFVAFVSTLLTDRTQAPAATRSLTTRDEPAGCMVTP